MAYQKCLERKSRLVSIKDSQERLALSEGLMPYKNMPIPHFWTSGTDFGKKKYFYWWGNGQMVTYADWWPGQPDNYEGREQCIMIGYGVELQKYGLNDGDCRLRYPYICQVMIGSTYDYTLY